MQENEFEKQVKEAMEGFKLTPSAPVWNRIEQQLPREKRRRRFIVFFFLFAGLGVSGYFLYNKLNNEGTSITKPETVIKKLNSTETLSDTKDKRDIEKEITAKKITPDTEQQQLLQKQQVAKITVQEQKKSGTRVLNGKNNQQQEVQQTFVPDNNEVTLNSFNDKTSNELPGSIITDPALQPNTKPAEQDAAALEMKPVDNIHSADSAINEITIIAAVQSDSSKEILSPDSLLTVATQAKKETVKMKPAQKWQLGVTALYGRADLVESFFNLGSNFDKAYDLSTPQGNTGGGSYIEYDFNVSRQVKAKNAFTIGLAVKRELSARSSLITGIEYTSLHTQIETGLKKDTTAIFYYNNDLSAQRTELNSFYRPGYGNTYTNSYSFIQIPVVYEHQLNRSKKIKVNWNAGLSLSQMVSTNAIVFDYNNQAFYSNNKLFRKTQVDMLAGLNMQFNNGKHATINLGPQFQYNFSNLFRSGSYGKQHLINYGLRATVLFKK